MGTLKKRTFQFSSSKREVKLYGNSFFITKAFEIGEGQIPNVFNLLEDKVEGKLLTTIKNPYRLSPDELMEIADYNVRLWLDFKESLRTYGTTNPKIFNRDDIKISGDSEMDDPPKKAKGKHSQLKENQPGKAVSFGNPGYRDDKTGNVNQEA